jgi:hypothetical protein
MGFGVGGFAPSDSRTTVTVHLGSSRLFLLNVKNKRKEFWD